MGRAAAVTFEMVVLVAEAMRAEKLDITNRAVRERLGNTGSFGTINTHLNAWRSRQEPPVTSVIALPMAAQKTILEYMQAELSRERQALETSIISLQREMSDIATENERQFDSMQKNAELIESLKATNASLEGRIGEMSTVLQDTKEEVRRARKNAETAHIEMTKALLRLEAMPRLEADLNAARATLEAEKSASRQAIDAERAARVAAEQASAVAAAKIDASAQRVQDLIERLAKAELAQANLSQT